jgi:glutamyl-tRNA reductase
MSDRAGHLIVVGLSHRTARIAQREKVALPPAQARAMARALRGERALAEAAVLSTCNRTELLAVAADPAQAADILRSALVARTRIEAAELAGATYVHHDRDAVRHLLCVAASLDSMVVGESEIQGQVRAALVVGREEHTVGPVLARAFRQALRTGRRVRRETRIGAGAVSVSSVAADLARTELGDLAGRRMLLIGAGRTAEATARALVGYGLGEVVVANRTPESAAQLARRLRGRAVDLDALTHELAAADVVIASTGAPESLLHVADVASALGRHARRRLVLIDIGVPRDVDPRVGELPGVCLHDIDDLERLAAANLDGRHLEARRALAIVDDDVRRFTRHAGERRTRCASTPEPSAQVWNRTASDVCG